MSRRTQKVSSRNSVIICPQNYSCFEIDAPYSTLENNFSQKKFKRPLRLKKFESYLKDQSFRIPKMMRNHIFNSTIFSKKMIPMPLKRNNRNIPLRRNITIIF